MVPLNSRLRGGEVADIIRRGKIQRLFVIGAFLARYYPQMLRTETMPEIRRRIVLRARPDQLGQGEERWVDFLAKAAQISDAALAEREAGVSPDTVADIMFTSGTIGAPKGAIFESAFPSGRPSLGGHIPPDERRELLRIRALLAQRRLQGRVGRRAYDGQHRTLARLL